MVTAPRFHCPVPVAVGALVDLPAALSHHAHRVLRLQSGDALTLFTGEGGEFSARIVALKRSQVSVEVLQWLPTERESSLEVSLVQALPGGQKMDLTVQKAVELGVTRIVPVVSRRSVMRLSGERALQRVDHWRSIVVAACEQCGRNRLPLVDEPLALTTWLQRTPPSGNIRRLVLAPGASTSFARLTHPGAGCRVEILIGAEGGLAEEEERLAAAAGFLSVRLGPRVLRTETAGLAALTAIQLLWGDLKEEMTDV